MKIFETAGNNREYLVNCERRTVDAYEWVSWSVDQVFQEPKLYCIT